MKSIQNQYIDLKEGRMSQANFMRNVRMTLPQYVTNVTSFKDAVRILKNKAILNELGPAAMQSAGNPEEEAEYKSTLVRKKSPEDDEEEIQALIDKYAEEESGKYTTGGEQFEISEDEEEAPEDYEDPDMFDAYGMDASEGKLREAEGIKINGKVVKNYKQNGDKSYSVKFEDGSEKTIAVSNDSWDVINNAAKEKLSEGRKKKEPKAEMHPNQIHPQELRMGIKVELEHTDDLDKAKKIALDHLAENPFYYTALKLSGIESPSAPKVKPPVEKKAKKKKEAVEMVDAANQMQKVKMPKVVKESLNEGGEWTITGTLTKDEQIELKDMIGDYELDVQATDDTLETTISHPMYNDKSLEQALKQVRGMLTPSKDKKDLGGSFDKFKSQLESLVREVLDEMYDGRDDMNAQNEY
jgi:hypothetical protein